MNDRPSKQEQNVLASIRRTRRQPSDVARARARSAFVAPTSRRAGIAPQLYAAAAVLVLFVVGFGSLPTTEWTLSNVDGPSDASRGLAPLALEVGEDFTAGRLTTGPETEIELARGPLLLRVRPGTDALIPTPPGRWFGRTRTIDVTRGEVFGSSGDAGPGFELVLRTPEATARLTGTTFAVFRTDEATCFCLYRGGIDVTPRDGSTLSLPVGHRVFVYDDGRPPRIEPLDAGETMKLRMIDDAATTN